MSKVSPEGLENLILQKTPLIDVRAPVEFAQGTLPDAVNLPIMDDAQREAVGTAYKKSGGEEALRLGHELVSGQIKNSRLSSWADYIHQHPNAVLFCFRGGLRSQITQRWLAEIGIEIPLIEGGYKMGRHFLREAIVRHSQLPFLILSGPTGSGKTKVLNQAASFCPTLDLEALAHHRGSAFGATSKTSPTQINFEHAIAAGLIRLSSHRESRILIEDESRLIGTCALPESFFSQMRASDLLYLEEPFDQRVENIFQDYVVNTPIGFADQEAALAQFEKFSHAVKLISRKLGGARAQEILHDLIACKNEYLRTPQAIDGNRAWIEKLLKYYYDPAYAQSLEKRNSKILIRGRSAAVMDYIKSL